MQKQELIHLHALCAELRKYVETRHDVPPDAFERYDRLGVEPTAIYRRKEAHKVALSRLLDELVEISEEEQENLTSESPSSLRR